MNPWIFVGVAILLVTLYWTYITFKTSTAGPKIKIKIPEKGGFSSLFT